MKYFKAIVLFLFYMLFFYLNEILLYFLLEKGILDSLSDFFFNILDIILYSSLTLILLLFFKKKNIRAKYIPRFNYSFVLLVLSLAILFRLVEDPFINAKYITNSVNLNINITQHHEISYNFFLQVLLIVLIGPLLEELVFRKMMLGYLGTNIIALILSSTFFALIHSFNGFDLSKIISAFLFGIILGLVYYKGGVFYSVLLHSFYNFIFILLNYLYNGWYEELIIKLNFGISYWFIVSLGIILILFILTKFLLPKIPILATTPPIDDEKKVRKASG